MTEAASTVQDRSTLRCLVFACLLDVGLDHGVGHLVLMTTRGTQ
jgi:hypothetical protein